MSLFKLPLRLFGLKDIPAVPFDIGGSIETLLRLDIRGHETQQALQGLTNEYTLDGETAPPTPSSLAARRPTRDHGRRASRFARC